MRRLSFVVEEPVRSLSRDKPKKVVVKKQTKPSAPEKTEPVAEEKEPKKKQKPDAFLPSLPPESYQIEGAPAVEFSLQEILCKLDELLIQHSKTGQWDFEELEVLANKVHTAWVRLIKARVDATRKAKESGKMLDYWWRVKLFCLQGRLSEHLSRIEWYLSQKQS